MLTPWEANKTRWREEKREKIKPRNPFYCCERAKEYNAAGGISCIMQVTTAAQLFQSPWVVSTSAANDAKCIMSGWGTRSRLSHWEIQTTTVLSYRNKRVTREGHPYTPKDTKLLLELSSRSCRTFFPAWSEPWCELSSAGGSTEGKAWKWCKGSGEWVPSAWWHKGWYFWRAVMEYRGRLSLLLKMCLKSCVYLHGPVHYSSSSFLLLPRLKNSHLQWAERPQH